MSLADEDTCIALILECLAKLLQHHRLYQREMMVISGAEMVEYAFSCVPVEVMGGEGDRCVLALQALCNSVQDVPLLESRFVKCLFFNLDIWWRSSF